VRAHFVHQVIFQGVDVRPLALAARFDHSHVRSISARSAIGPPQHVVEFGDGEFHRCGGSALIEMIFVFTGPQVWQWNEWSAKSGRLGYASIVAWPIGL